MKLLTLNIENIRNCAKSKKKSEKGYVPNSIRRARKILKILTRDNFKCVKCGNPNDLTIDHINGRKFAKHENHQKYKVDKCETLCEKCHIEKNLNTLIKMKGGIKMEEDMKQVEKDASVEEKETTEVESSEDSE